MTQENSGTFGVPNQILQDTGTEPFKTHKIGNILRKPSRTGSQHLFLLAVFGITAISFLIYHILPILTFDEMQSETLEHKIKQHKLCSLVGGYDMETE
jgi:hypothetical protein